LKNRQYSLKVLETTVDDEKKFMEFFNTHYPLFKDHLILIQGEISQDVENYLQEKNIKYLNNITLPKGRSRKALEEELNLNTSTQTNSEECKTLKEEIQELKVENTVNQQIAQTDMRKAQEHIEKLSKKLNSNLTVMDTMIRSGREIDINGDLLLLNRVNSGATIKTTGSLIVTQVVEGSLRCDGNFMMITVSPKANIVFNGVEVDNKLLENKLNRIELRENKIHITPVIKKDINWA
jgi:septum site-determining protein MinC